MTSGCPIWKVANFSRPQLLGCEFCSPSTLSATLVLLLRPASSLTVLKATPSGRTAGLW